MDLGKEITNHLEWIEKIASLLGDEEVTEEALAEVTRHDKCELGRWLSSEESTGYKNFPEFPELIESHNTFHELAGELIAALQQENEAMALESEKHFIEMSQKVIGHLQALEEKRAGGTGLTPF